MNYLKKEWLLREAKSLLITLLGSFICGLAVNLFYLPTMLTMGGISGVASLIYNLSGTSLSIGTITVLLNLPVFLLGIFFVSRIFIVRSLIGTFIFALMLDFTHWLSTDWYVLLVLGGDTQGSPDYFLCAVVGGALFGLGLGLIILARYTTGGTDILAVILRKKIHGLSLGMGLWLIDGLVVISSAVAYRKTTPNSLNMALYSTISLYLCAKAIDLVLEGFNFKRTAIIISRASRRISERILFELGRGITGLHGKGMYTDEEKTVLLCVLSKSQIPQARAIVAEEDSLAFFIVMDTREVLGEGFEAGGVF